MIKEILREQKEIDSFISKVIDSEPEYIALDIETDWFSENKWSPLQLGLDGIGIYDGVNAGFIVHKEGLDYGGLDYLVHNNPVITQNGKFDFSVLLNLGYISFLEDIIIHDTKILSHMCDENRDSHSLKDMVISVLKKDTVVKLSDVGQKPIMEKNLLTMTEESQKDFKENILGVWEEKLGSYCIDDCVNTYELFFHFKENIPSPRVWAIYEKIELPFLKVLIQMEIAGINLDIDYLKGIGDKIQDKILDLQIEIYKEAGTDFNIGSAKQIQEVFSNMKIDIPEKFKTSKGGVSTNIATLKYLSQQGYKIAELILKWRKFSKLDSGFIQSLIDKTIKGKIHCGFNQTGTITGRLSSNNPNLQNLPSRSDEFDIRKAFVAKPNHSFIISDLSQAELRILAHFSQEKVLLDAFNNNEDIHKATADKLGIDRSSAKAVNFGIIYGISSYGLAAGLEITRVKADEIIKDYFSELPSINKFIKTCYNTVEKNKYINTILGRFRHFPKYGIKPTYPIGATAEEKKKIRLQSFKDKSSMERQIVNSLIQGSAADYIKLAMRNIQKKITEYGATILVTIHDEIVCECPDENIKKVSEIVKYEMENAIRLNGVPVVSSLQVSKFWCK